MTSVSSRCLFSFTTSQCAKWSCLLDFWSQRWRYAQFTKCRVHKQIDLSLCAKEVKHAEVFTQHCLRHTPACHVMEQTMANNSVFKFRMPCGYCGLYSSDVLVWNYKKNKFKWYLLSLFGDLSLDYSHHDSAADLSARMHLTNRMREYWGSNGTICWQFSMMHDVGSHSWWFRKENKIFVMYPFFGAITILSKVCLTGLV